MPTLPERLALLDALDGPSADLADRWSNLGESDLRELVEAQGVTWNPDALRRSQVLAAVRATRKPLGPWQTRWRAMEDYAIGHYTQTKLGFMGVCMALPLWANWPHILERGWPELWPILLIMACQPRLTQWIFGRDVEEFQAMIEKERSLVEALPASALNLG